MLRARPRARACARLLALFLGATFGLAAAAADPPALPHLDLTQNAAGFWGPGRERPDPPLPERVSVGLLGPGQGEAGQELRRGAELALEQANAQGGYRGLRPYALVFRADDGPWGMAAKQVVALAYDDQVWAIVGGLDGQRVHLAELVTAKLWVPVITPWAVDRTIDYANVPWVFRLSVDDGRQAEALLGYAAARQPGPLRVLAEEEREARVGSERTLDAARRLGLPAPEVSTFSPLTLPEQLVASVLAPIPDLRSPIPHPLLLWARPAIALPLLRELRRQHSDVLLLAPAGLVRPEAATIEGLVVASPLDLAEPSPALAAFARDFRSRYGVAPSPLAVLAHEAMAITLRALGEAGLNRARIRDALSRSVADGPAGAIRFDALGGNTAAPVLLQARAGQWVRVTAVPRADGR